MKFDNSVCAEAVVVGDDGSADAALAVQWAFADASRRRAPLVVLRAWTLTSAPRPASFEPGYVPSEDEFSAAVSLELQSRLASILGDDLSAGDVDVRPTPVHQPASEALIAASEVAQLVVVGSRGRGLARALLGSTSEQVVRHARGPIAIVPAGKR